MQVKRYAPHGNELSNITQEPAAKAALPVQLYDRLTPIPCTLRRGGHGGLSQQCRRAPARQIDRVLFGRSGSSRLLRYSVPPAFFEEITFKTRVSRLPPPRAKAIVKVETAVRSSPPHAHPCGSAPLPVSVASLALARARTHTHKLICTGTGPTPAHIWTGTGFVHGSRPLGAAGRAGRQGWEVGVLHTPFPSAARLAMHTPAHSDCPCLMHCGQWWRALQ
jgi:hypothetical protein